MKTFVVNLERSVERKKAMDQLLSGFPQLDVEYISAVDGKALQSQEQEELFDSDRFARTTRKIVRPGEIGCTLSHQKCYQEILKRNIDVALILEDDIVIEDGFAECLSEVYSLLDTENPTIVLLSGWYWFSQLKNVNNCLCLANVTDAYLTHAYALNKAAAKLMIDKRPWYVADSWKMFRNRGIQIWGIHPHVVDQDWSGEIMTVVNDSSVKLVSPSIVSKLIIHLRGLSKKILKLRGFEKPTRE